VPPVLTVASDGWHVNAYLPGTDRFVFVVKVAGQPDVYSHDVASPFLIDPLAYGGKSVSVSAGAASSHSNLWAPAVTVNVPLPRPVLTVASDGWHVSAYLPGTDRFVFVVKVVGLPDFYFLDQASPFVINRERFGARSVSVSARAKGAQSNPWASPDVHIDVPVVKLFGVVDANGGQPDSGADAKNLGITIDRIEFTYGVTTIEQMDAEVALDTGQGLTPLVLLSQYGRISQFDRSGWQNWASMVVSRYGPGGAFWQGRTDGQYAPTYFEVLNEPYGYSFYEPPEPGAYATLFVNVVSAAKVANPDAKFLLASSPHPFQHSKSSPLGSRSWDAMLKASPDGPRAQLLADGVTTHPYGSFTAAKGWHTAVATHNNFPQLPVWITEVGYRIGEEDDGIVVTESLQGAWMQRSLVDFVNWPWARAYVWFKWADYGAANMWGVVRPDGTHRPSYDAYRTFISSHNS
jgi:hypothetical protein